MIITGYENYREFYDTAVFEKHVLGNGATIWMQTVPLKTDAKGVVIACFPTIGSVRDPKNKTGLAHFFEHIFNRGTRRKPTLEDIILPIEALGGSWGASTSMYSTKYQIEVDEDSFPLAVETVLEMSMAPAIRDEDVILEAGVILQERRQRFASPSAILENDINECLYGKDSIFHPVIGSVESISGITGDDLRAFQAKFYHAQNLHIICGGAFATRPQSALAMLEDTFGDLPGSNEPLKPMPPLPDLLTKKIELKNARYGCDSLTLGWVIPRLSESIYPLQILAKATGNGFSAPLVNALRRTLGISYDARLMSAHRNPDPYPWGFSMKVQVEERHFDTVYDLTMQSLSELSSDRIIAEHRKRQIVRRNNFKHSVSSCYDAVGEILLDGHPTSFANSADENDGLALESVLAWRDYLVQHPPIEMRISVK